MSRLKRKLDLLNHLHSGDPTSKQFAPKKMIAFSDDLLKNIPSFKGGGVLPEIKNDVDCFWNAELRGADLESSIPFVIKPDNAIQDYLHLERDLSKFWKSYKSFIEKALEITKESLVSLVTKATDPSELLFMDIETCGFSGNPIIMIGVGFLQAGQLKLEQYFARDYSEEEHVLRAYVQRAKTFSTLVTFNGKRFDSPFIEERLGMYQLESPSLPQHIDLYPLARKIFSGALPNYKLQTLEQVFCRRRRTDDLGGGEIPAAYFEYIDNPQDVDKMARAVHHNALDIITLVELLVVMADGKGRSGEP